MGEMNIRRVLLSLLAVAILALGLGGCNGDGGKAKAEAPAPAAPKVKVSVKEVNPEPIRDILILPGETKPADDVTVAANLGGRVVWFGPEEGDKVEKGATIARIDVSELRAALDNALANLKLARQNYNRRKLLFERRIISAEELDQSRTGMVTAEGEARRVKATYDNAFVKSPINGVVNETFIDPGEFLPQGGRVAEIINVDQIEIEVNVPEMDVPYIKEGQPVMVQVDALPNNRVGGVVDFVAYKANPATKTFRVKIRVDNSDGRIRPGMIARVGFQKRIVEDALVAPLFALVDKGGERLVYVAEDGKAHARVVDLGVIEGDRIQITHGLKPGDQLIVTGQNDVQEGTPVVIQ